MNRYFASSLLVSFCYCFLGFVLLNVHPEYLLLASAIVVVAGLLPDIDGSENVPARELAGLLAAVSPLMFFELYPGFTGGSVSRIALVVICCYALSRIFLFKLMRSLFSPRGMIHSIPAAIVTGQAVFLIFWDMHLIDRSFVAVGAFVGFFAHLVLEAYSRVDFVASAVGERVDHAEPVLKLYSRSLASTAAVYGAMIFLGAMMLREIFPNFGVSAYLTY